MDKKTNSSDGTAIAYERVGTGPAVILVSGALSAGSSMEPLAARLSAGLGAVPYDRRGRGASGDTAPYAVSREVEDIAALIDAVGGSAALYGMSSGAALALEAAASGLAVTRVAVYEPLSRSAQGAARSARSTRGSCPGSWPTAATGPRWSSSCRSPACPPG